MIDVSSYQGSIDWTKVKESGVKRTYIKLGEDGQPIDAYAITNVHHARAAGVQVGWYYFAHPGTHGASVSAARFLELASGHILAGDLPPALDLEVEEGLSLGQLNTWKAAWFVDVDAAIGTLAVFYSFLYFLNAFTFKPDRPLWGAHPTTITDAERARWSFWQHGEGRVPGISGLVDFDIPLHPDNIPSVAQAL